MTVEIDHTRNNITAGSDGHDGDLDLRSGEGITTIYMEGETGEILLKADRRDRMRFEPKGGDCWIGGNGESGTISLFHFEESDVRNRDKATIYLNGRAGDIVLRNADCAEEFSIAVAEEVEPGTVMVIDDEGKVRPSTDAYDKRVVGVVSGAGDYKPGLVLDRQISSEKRLPISLMGKVYCKVDAQYTPIDVGDLLTTSPSLGHAMKAADPSKAFGAVIGKALRPLKEGVGLIPILISVQ